MKKIGLLSDTHAYWDKRFEEYFANCDEIWHAGDMCDFAHAMRFREFKPFRAVCGNCDGGDLRHEFPEILRWKCEGVDVLMKHIGGYPGNYDRSVSRIIYANPPRLFISGHSHILRVKYDKTLGLLHINPGAAGLQGWQKVRTLVRFEIDNTEIKDLEVVELK
ncbi:MAG: metallophosphoesterase family protein [Bacteroidaceae bacterium]|nr:metallophosphoesterase family protein [Bacteroidaceae bacterium]